MEVPTGVVRQERGTGTTLRALTNSFTPKWGKLPILDQVTPKPDNVPVTGEGGVKGVLPGPDGASTCPTPRSEERRVGQERACGRPTSQAQRARPRPVRATAGRHPTHSRA